MVELAAYSDGPLGCVCTSPWAVVQSACALFLVVNCVWPFFYLFFAIFAPVDLRKKIGWLVVNDTRTQQCLSAIILAVTLSGAPLRLKQNFHASFGPLYDSYMEQVQGSPTKLCLLAVSFGPALHMFCFFVFGVPNVIFQKYPEIFQKSKIQKNREDPTVAIYKKVTLTVLKSQLLHQSPFVALQGLIVLYFDIKIPYAELSSLEWYQLTSLFRFFNYYRIHIRDVSSVSADRHYE